MNLKDRIMKSKLNNIDIIFIIALFFIFSFFMVFVFTYPFFRDEAFYLSTPFRIVNGDSLIKHEWHLTQFSSLFSYLPTFLWVKLMGHVDGIFIFSRCIYLTLQTVLTILVYVFFRKYRMWAVVASVLFFTQGTNIMLQISYHTMLMSFLLLLTICVILIYKKTSVWWYVLSGMCYGACCICDPGLCLTFGFYIIFCVLWKKKSFIFENLHKIKTIILKNKDNSARNINSNKKQSRKKYKTNNRTNNVPQTQNYDCFFSGKAIGFIFFGIVLIAAIAIVFFLATGGTFSDLLNNLANLLSFSEYRTQGSFLNNLITKIDFAVDSLNINPFLLFFLVLMLFWDKKRYKNSHRCFYIAFAFIVAVIYAVGVYKLFFREMYFVEFPFFIITLVCYIITKNKNKLLFHCMWLPAAIAAVFHFFSSNSLLSAICVVIIINNTAGVFFVADLVKEMFNEEEYCLLNKKSDFFAFRTVVLVAVLLQLFFHISFFQYGGIFAKANNCATSGPYSGIKMNDSQFDNYTKSMSDLDFIKEKADEDAPIYIVSHRSCWMYMYIGLPVANYTTYYLDLPERKALSAYYKENPDRIPKFIYVDYMDYGEEYDYELLNRNIDDLSELFSFTQENLSNGVLLSVNSYKFSEADLGKQE